MKDFQKTLKELRELSTINEETKALLEKMTGKELVDYESIDALVGALMTHYNGELKKKAQTSHNQDGNTINKLTGYAKAAAIAGILPTDSLIVALGKLEKALDEKAQLSHSHKKSEISDFPDFGTNSNQILEGVKLAETLGIPYGGGLNNSNTKTAGYAYYDSTTKKTYKCTVTNTLNYADASKYEAISNADLLAKFQNFNIYSIGNNANGRYIKFTNGLIIQTGKSGGGTKNFPIAFKSAVFTFVTAGANPTSSWTLTTFNFNDMSFGTSSKPSTIPWLAIGI